MMKHISIPYGKTYLECDIPEERCVGVFTGECPVSDVSPNEQLRNALDNPIASMRLEEIAADRKSVVVITSDHTRPVPSRIIMPHILERLRSGNPDIDITILVATGLHRGTTVDELKAKMGDDIVANEKIVIHDARDASQMVDLGRLPSGGSLRINRHVMEAELVVAEGFIEPHFFAGFSGGRKAILPGVSSAETIMANHCAEFISSPFARTGNLENNPVHKDMLYAAKMAKLAFIVNVVLNDKKEIVYAVAGDPVEAHLNGCRHLAASCQVSVPVSDVVITSNGGYPLDQNLYQSCKGADTAEKACRKGGVIIMVSSCCDGHGGNSFYSMLSQAKSPQELLASIEAVPRDKTAFDQWQVQIMARIMSKCHMIYVTTDYDPQQLKEMGLLHATSLQQAIDMADSLLGGTPSIAVIPNGVSVIPAAIPRR